MDKIFNAMDDLVSGFDTYAEHLFHDTYQEGCSECWAENKLLKAHNWDHLYPEGRNQHALSRSDYSTNPNPLD